MGETPRHRVIRGLDHLHRVPSLRAAGLPPALMPPVSAHARLRGPYTAGGVIAKAVVADALARRPGLVRRHDIEIRALAPEQAAHVPVTRETLFNRVPRARRTRLHSRQRTLRLAHGLVDLLRDHLAEADAVPRTLVVGHLDNADPTDAELVAVMLRRLDPALLTLVVCTGGGPLDDGLGEALDRHCAPLAPEPVPPADLDERRLAELYVDTDGTTRDPRALAAYERLDPETRAWLHDRRAGLLSGSGEWSWRLGAVPYHLERGSDPRGAGVRALLAALEHCADLAFHHACVDLGDRGRRLTDPGGSDGPWWEFTRRAAVSLAMLGRGEEAERLWDEIRAASADPDAHRTAAYETAMLYARYHEPGRLDPARAAGWVNQAIAFASALPDPRDRAFFTSFYGNGLALVRMRAGDLDGALRLVDEGIARMEKEGPPGDDRALDRCSLLSNRARLLGLMGGKDEAVEAYDALVALDPDYGEYHFDRANALHDAGRDDEARAAYDRAAELCLPFPELFYNRAQVRLAGGDAAGALADLDRVLDLAPGLVDAYVNRSGLRAAEGDLDGAWSDVLRGLALDPGNAYLTCTAGQLEAAAGRHDEARASFDAAIAAEPGIAAAWAGRAALRFDAGDVEGALDDLTRALLVDEDPALLVNRAVAYRTAGRHVEAITDLERALGLDPADADAAALLAELRR